MDKEIPSMLTAEELNVRIEKLEAKASKLEAKIAKKSKEINELRYQLKSDPNNRSIKIRIENLEWDYRIASQDLVTAQDTLNKYYTQLENIQKTVRDIKPIAEFLDTWKERCLNYYIDELKSNDKKLAAQTVEAAEEAYREYFNEGRFEDYNAGVSDKDIKAKLKLKEEAMNTAQRRYESRYGEIDEIWDKADHNLNSYKKLVSNMLTVRADKKYDNIIDNVTRRVGRIISAKNLRISLKGELDGIIEGETKNCKILTFDAGTDFKWTSSQQCYHFRTKYTVMDK